jgi:tetratricopeptide (TPR) repeat protein
MDALIKFLRTLSGRQHHSRNWPRHASPDEHSPARREVVARRGAWLVKQEVSLWHLAMLVCALLVLIWVGWRVVAQTAAQSLAKSHPDAALSWVADQPTALNQLAQKELLGPDGNLDAAKEWAQRALRSYPLSARSLTLLGLIAERKGDQKSADALMQISGAWTWRDQTAQAWLFNRETGRGDYPRALLHVDALLRLDPQPQTELFPTLSFFTTNPQAFKALTSFLSTSPPWRTWFLSELSARLANQARLVQLYAALNETENPPTNEELRPYLNRLIKDGDFEKAYKIWQARLPSEQRGNVIQPFNHDFDIPVDGLPFNWSLETSPEADIRIMPSVDGDRKRALRVQFSGARVRFANVKQLMLLPAGDYTFSGRVKTEELRTSRGLWWRIFCANDPGKTLANTELVSGTMPWIDFTVELQVPAVGCSAQWLQLELPARIDSELRIEGQVWYQDLRIIQNTKAGH